jgi:V/A-type H+-transporting ATPase subunit A
METAKSIREDFLHQNAFDNIDTYSSFKKMVLLMELIRLFHEQAKDALENNVSIIDITVLPVRERIARAKFTPENNLDEFDKIKGEIEKSFQELKEKALAEV